MADPRRSTRDASPATTPKAGRREWIGLAVIALPCMLYSMDLTVLNLAVPSLSANLKPSSAELLWIIDIYGFMVAGFLITMGTLGDRIGRRRLLLIGAVAFGIASVIAAFSNSAEMLIATRALLGVAGATLAPSTLSLIRNMFHDPQQRTVAVGVWVMSYSAGAAVGPLVGGILLEHYWWGSVFLVGVPVMLLLLVLGPILLPEYRDPSAGRLDPTSAALSLVAVLSVIYGLKQIAENGLQLLPVGAIGLGLAVGLLFVRRQQRLRDPLIELRLFRVRAFSAALVTYMLATFVVFGAFVFVSQYLQLVLGFSPLEAGLWTMPWPLAFVVGSMVTPLLARRYNPVSVMMTGLLVSAVGFGMLTLVDTGPGVALLITGSVVYSFGLSPVFTLTNDMIIAQAPPERAGAAAALSETGSELGGALGIAILGSIGTAIYRGRMAHVVPTDLPPDAAEAARSTLGGALAVARQFPDQLGTSFLAPAREAFTDGLQLTMATSALVALVLAFTTARVLRPAHAPATQPLAQSSEA